MLSFFLLRVMDLTTRISEGAMKLMFELNGWNLMNLSFIRRGLRDDFYPDSFIIGTSNKGYIYASGSLAFLGQTFDSINSLLSQYTNSALIDFNNWEFLEEKEWVITRNGDEFLYSFTTLDKLPKASKLRC